MTWNQQKKNNNFVLLSKNKKIKFNFYFKGQIKKEIKIVLNSKIYSVHFTEKVNCRNQNNKNSFKWL